MKRFNYAFAYFRSVNDIVYYRFIGKRLYFGGLENGEWRAIKSEHRTIERALQVESLDVVEAG